MKLDFEIKQEFGIAHVADLMITSAIKCIDTDKTIYFRQFAHNYFIDNHAVAMYDNYTAIVNNLNTYYRLVKGFFKDSTDTIPDGDHIYNVIHAEQSPKSDDTVYFSDLIRAKNKEEVEFILNDLVKSRYKNVKKNKFVVYDCGRLSNKVQSDIMDEISYDKLTTCVVLNRTNGIRDIMVSSVEFDKHEDTYVATLFEVAIDNEDGNKDGEQENV